MKYEFVKYDWSKHEHLHRCIGSDTVAVLPDNISNISSGCFKDSPNLEKVIIPEALQSEDLMFDCFSELGRIVTLKEIEVHPDNKKWVAVDGILFHRGTGNYCIYPCAKQGYFELPEDWTLIRDMAFQNRHGLTGVRIHKGIDRIGDSAFDGCSGLKELTIEKGVRKIQHRAFKECTSLTELTIPGSVAAIGWPTDRPDDGAFSNCTGLKRVQFDEGLEIIGNYAFEGCENLTSISLPKSVRIISKRAFYRCKNLKEVIIPDELKKNEDLFEGFSEKVQIISAKSGRVLRGPSSGPQKKTAAAKPVEKSGPVWALCEMQKSYKQCSVALKSEKTYAYASNYAIKAQDIAVIGTKLKGTSVSGATSGQIGKISEIAQSFSADRAHLLVLDFAFSTAPTKKTLKSNALILQREICGGDLCNDAGTLDNLILHPITLMVRKVFAALTILSFPENAESVWIECATKFLKDGIFKSDDLEQIKEICSSARFEPYALKLWEAYLPDLDTLKQSLQALEQSEAVYPAESENYTDEQNIYFQGKRSKAYREYLIESTLTGTINILVQTDMKNLLDVLLKAKPKTKELVNKIKGLYQ